MKNHLTTWALAIPLLLLAFFAQAQERQKTTFILDRIEADKEAKALRLFLIAQDELGQDMVEADKSKFLVIETSEKGTYTVNPEEVKKQTSYLPPDKNDPASAANANLHLLILLDLSGSMNKDNKLPEAKRAIQELVNSEFMSGVDLQFAWFHEDVGESKNLNPKNFNDVVGMVEATGDSTDFRGALKKKVREMASKEGKKAIILVTDGKHATGETSDEQRMAVEAEIVSFMETQIKDSLFLIFPIGIGNDPNADFLQKLTAATEYPYDDYTHGVAPKDLADKLRIFARKLRSNVELIVLPNQEHGIYGKEVRQYVVQYLDSPYETVPVGKIFGTASGYLDLRRMPGIETNYLLVIFIGALLVLGLLGIFVLAVPMYNNYYFKKHHIRKYGEIKRPNVTARDPLIQELIRDEEDVVVFDGKVMLLDTWKHLRGTGEGQMAKGFEHFFQHHVKGSFFSQRGLYRKFNWLWFGALGGLTGWSLHALLDGIEWAGLRQFLVRAFDTESSKIADAVYENLFIGMAIGFGLSLLLAIVEEIGQSRKFSVGRVLLRAMIGLLAGVVIFFLSNLFTAKVLPLNNYLSTLIDWTIFGTVIGLTCTFFSSIETKSGLLGGAIASLVAMHFYYLLTRVHFLNPEIASVIGFILYGSLLGFILHAVVRYLEDFELKYVQPKEFYGQVKPISKWLKSPGIEAIYIGASPKCEVYVKWDDKAVKNKHAKMTFFKNTVYVEPHEGEVIVNGRTISQKTALSDQDRILLGGTSISEFLLVAKEKSAHGSKEDNKEAFLLKNSPHPHPHPTGKPGNKEIQDQIIIKPKKNS